METVQGHCDLFIDTSPSPRTPPSATSLRVVTDGTPRGSVCSVAVLRCCVIAVEAVQGHRDLFIDTSPSPRTPPSATSLRVVTDGTPRRLSSESSHSDASCHIDFAAVSTFGTPSLQLHVSPL